MMKVISIPGATLLPLELLSISLFELLRTLIYYGYLEKT